MRITIDNTKTMQANYAQATIDLKNSCSYLNQHWCEHFQEWNEGALHDIISGQDEIQVPHDTVYYLQNVADKIDVPVTVLAVSILRDFVGELEIELPEMIHKPHG